MLTRPSLLLHIEEATLLALTIYAYHHFHFSWLLFAILFLTPDLFMLGYLINTCIGSTLYNLVHTLTLPLTLLLASYIEHWPLTTALALIWTAHIAFDRLLGSASNIPPASKTPTSSTSELFHRFIFKKWHVSRSPKSAI